MVKRAASEWPRATHWRTIVQQWALSHQTPEAFCREHQLNTGTFLWWRGQLKKQSKRETLPTKDSKKAISFVEIRRSDVAAAASSETVSRYELQLSNGRKILIDDHFREEAIGKLIRLMERVPC